MTAIVPKKDAPIPDDLWPLRCIRLAEVRRRLRHQEIDQESEIDALLIEFGDPRAVLRAVLHDFDLIVSDYEALISGGFVRRPPPVET